MRLFIAVNLPAAEKHRLGTVLDELRRSLLPVRWIDDDSLHITLKFLGEARDQLRPDIAAVMRDTTYSAAPFDIRLDGFGTFPPRGRARVIWIRVHAPPLLFDLQQQLEQKMEPLGFAREPRDFHPHITIARASSNSRGVIAADVDRITRDIVYNAIVRVESIDLMRSHLSARGARYERIERVTLESMAS